METMQNNKDRHHDMMFHNGNAKHSSMYKRFAIMAAVMFVAMYFIMYAMIDGLDNLIFNLNNLYMALLMTAAMLLIELIIMRNMYTHKKNNFFILIISIAVGGFSWFGIRQQIGVGDEQFIKGMIPHHAAAILMSEKTVLTDPELIQLQENILKTQAEEIELMKRKLKEFEKR